MAITYTWLNADSTSLKYVDDSTTPNTEKFIPVAAGNRDYAAYLAWVAEGNTATPYVAPGYEDLASAKTSRLADAAEELTSFIKSGSNAFSFFRALADSTYTLPTATGTKLSDAYALLDTFETAINSETDIEKIRLSTIDYEADTYDIPT